MEAKDLLDLNKQFQNITWEDSTQDTLLLKYIESSMTYLLKIAGVEELDFTSGLACDLLLNRVLYMNSHALDDFETNYSALLNELRMENAKDVETTE